MMDCHCSLTSKYCVAQFVCVCVWFRQLIVQMALCPTAVDLSATSNYTHTLLINDFINSIIREGQFISSLVKRAGGGRRVPAPLLHSFFIRQR